VDSHKYLNGRGKIMNKKDAVRIIKKASAVFAWVTLTNIDGAYLKVFKSSVLLTIHAVDTGDDIDFDIVLRNGNHAYIN
jgi:hypothetical protein